MGLVACLLHWHWGNWMTNVTEVILTDIGKTDHCQKAMKHKKALRLWHYYDVIMNSMSSQITSSTIVYSSVCSGADKRKHQSFASLAFVRGIHRWPVNSPHKWPVTRKMFPFDDVIMLILGIYSNDLYITMIGSFYQVISTNDRQNTLASRGFACVIHGAKNNFEIIITNSENGFVPVRFHCWRINNWAPNDKLRYNSYLNAYVFFPGNTFKYVAHFIQVAMCYHSLWI